MRRALGLSIIAALVAATGSVIALWDAGIYASLTDAFLPQAIAQDVANLAVAAPWMLLLARASRRGSLRAFLVWLGVVLFTVYNYVIYAFSIPFGPLFPLWVAVLGMTFYAGLFAVIHVRHARVAAAHTDARATRVVAWALVVTAILFGALWMSEDLPALLTGARPQSLTALALPTNPVHILDYAFFLPGVIGVGVTLQRGRAVAHTFAVPMLVFLVLTGIPVLLTPVVQLARRAPAVWGAVPPIGALTVGFIGLIGWLLPTIRSTGDWIAEDETPSATAT